VGIREIRRITQSKRTACRIAGALGLIFATPVVAEIASSSQGSIIVEGNRRVDAETVRSYFHPAPDGHFDETTRDAALKALIATGLFDKVSIERAGERLVVHVSEAPVLDRVALSRERPDIKGPDQSRCASHIVGCIGRIERLDQPHPMLRK
jgi:outer membrane protein insertion porin family